MFQRRHDGNAYSEGTDEDAVKLGEGKNLTRCSGCNFNLQ